MRKKKKHTIPRWKKLLVAALAAGTIGGGGTIKGNFDEQKNVKIYATSACDHYSQIIIQKHQGDDWFCTEKEAQAVGFTKSDTCK